MDQLQFAIAQGSTPRVELLLPFSMPSGTIAFATFAQNNTAVLEFGMNGTPTEAIAGAGTLTKDAEDSSMLVLEMTQEDTLALKPGDAELQVRVKTNDGADTFFPIPGVIIKAIKPGVIL